MIILGILLILAASSGTEGDARLLRRESGSTRDFEFHKVLPNPMAHPGAILTSVNIPDSVDVSFTLLSTSGDTLASHQFLDVSSGAYTISWSLTHSIIRSGRYIFVFQATSKSGSTMYLCRNPVFLLTE